MKLEQFTEHQYRKFSCAEGSQYIASEFAILKILELVKKFRPENILEVGVGIGTISDSILKVYKNSYTHEVYATEDNKFCISQLPKNLGSSFQNLKLYESIQDLPKNLKMDVIIIDGKDSNLKELKSKMRPHCILVVEGDRKSQTDLISRILPKSKFVHSITSEKNNSYSNRPKDHYKGGVKIIFTNPDWKQNIEWLRLKTLSKIHFQLRKLA